MPKYTFARPYYNVAQAANSVATEEAWNVYYEAMPQGGFAIRRRPGLIRLDPADTNLPGRGVYWSDRSQRLYMIRGGNVYVKAGFNTEPTLIGTITDVNKTAIFAEGQKLDLAPLIYIANGSRLSYIDNVANTVVSPTDGNTPTSTFITMMNNRFYANDIDHDQDFLITDVDPGSGLMDVTYWSSATNPWRAAQKPDAIRGLYSGWNEVYVWGSMACEVWQEDGVTPISPLIGSLMEIGVEAPYSMVMADNTMLGLCVVAGKRAVITVQGRGPKVISEPIANILQSYAVVTDAIGSLCFVGGLNMYVLCFPTEDKTWAYDFKNDVWCQWSSWDLDTARNLMFKGYYGTYAKSWNKHVMLGNEGNLYEFRRDQYQDDDAPIHSSIRTGWLDHGTWDRKRSDQLIIKLQGYSPVDAKILLRHRSDGQPEWSTAIEIEIRTGQQNDHFCKLNRMGTYRSRQYEFIMTDAADLALVGLEEDLSKMRN